MPRVAVEYRTSSRDCYNDFCKENPGIALSFEKYKEIIYTLNSTYSNYVLEGEKIKLPHGFGSLAINKKKQKHKVKINDKERICLAVNWVESKKLGKKIYYTNSHSEGYRYKWFWFKSEAFLPETFIWGFKPSRVNSRKLAHLLKQDNSPYIHLYREYTSNY